MCSKTLFQTDQLSRLTYTKNVSYKPCTNWDEPPFWSLGELQSHEQKPGECMLIPDGYWWGGMGGHRDMKRSEDGNLSG